VANIAKPHRPDYPKQEKASSDPPIPTQEKASSDRPPDDVSEYGFGPSTDVSEYGLDPNLSTPGPPATYTQTLTTTDTAHPEEDLRTDVTVPGARQAEAEDPNFRGGESGPPTLRVVTGGGKTTPTADALWPALVPALPTYSTTVAVQAIATMRRNLADRKRGRKAA
jgi:hypothetical protein